MADVENATAPAAAPPVSAAGDTAAAPQPSAAQPAELATPATPPKPAEPGPVPYQRFKFVNDQFRQVRAELEKLRGQQAGSSAQPQPARQGQPDQDDEDRKILEKYVGPMLSPLQERLDALQHERTVDALVSTTKAAVAGFPDVDDVDVYAAIRLMSLEEAATADPYDVAKSLQAKFDERFDKRSKRQAPALEDTAAAQLPGGSGTAAPQHKPSTPPRPRSAGGQFQAGDPKDRMPDGRHWSADPDERYRRSLLARGLELPKRLQRA